MKVLRRNIVFQNWCMSWIKQVQGDDSNVESMSRENYGQGQRGNIRPRKAWLNIGYCERNDKRMSELQKLNR